MPNIIPKRFGANIWSPTGSHIGKLTVIHGSLRDGTASVAMRVPIIYTTSTEGAFIILFTKPTEEHSLVSVGVTTATTSSQRKIAERALAILLGEYFVTESQPYSNN